MTAKHSCAALLLVLAALGLSASPALGQVKLRDQDYTKGQSPFPNLLKPYTPIHVSPPVLTNPPRVEQLVQNGMMTLSLQDAIALALEDNLDISVQRYSTLLAETDVLKQKAGTVTRFDPVATATLGWQRASIPVNNPFLSGTGLQAQLTALTNQNSIVDFGYSQGFATGTTYAVTFNNIRQSTTSPANLLNPSITSSFNLGFSQPLLSGFGFLPNRRFLIIARNSQKIADLQFQQQIITTVTQVENLYYELVFAQEDVEVKKKALETAEKLYNDNKKQVEIGTLAPIEVTRAGSEVARTRGDLIVSQTVELQQQTLLRNAISKRLLDPSLINVKINPTDRATKPIEVPPVTLEDAVREALQKRPDIRQARIDLNSREVTRRATRNALLPQLTLSGQYGATGLAGNARTTTKTPSGFTANIASPLVDAMGNPVMVNGVPVFAGTQVFTTATTFTQAGLSDALRSVFESNFPTYGVQLNLSIPIRNRSAQADNARAQLEERQSQTSLQRLENSVAVDVRNAEIALEQNRARVDAAIQARILAEQTLDAEQKKFQLGASTIFFVVQAQRDLATARSTEVRALVDLTESKINFDRALGRTLEVNKIDIADTKHDRIDRVPLIPGTVSGEVVGAPGKF